MVYCIGLENRQVLTGLVGSNPTFPAVRRNMSSIARTYSHTFKIPFYASSGRKWILTLLYTGLTNKNYNSVPDLPVSIREGADDTIQALYSVPNIKSVYPSLADMSFDLCLTITDYEIEKSGSVEN